MTLAKTPLHALHQELGARLVPFAGYEMPLQYPAGILKEHLHTRAQAGLFDVSHMGQILVHGPQAAQALESLMPVDLLDLPAGQQRYALLTDENGGILDDLMVANLGNERLLLVVNAACKRHDLEHLQEHLDGRCAIEPLFEARALLALQGPRAAAVLSRLAPEVTKLTFMQIARIELLGHACFVSRSGYTGEDGFEISVPSGYAEALARRLLQEAEVQPVGLGARDSLRLEAGLCLYGHDMDVDTTPVEAGLNWAISKVRREDGARAGGFPGAERIFAQLRDGVERRRVGLLGAERVPVREGTRLVDDEGNWVGRVSSGTFGPTLGAPVSMGYVSSRFAAPETQLWAEVRGKRVAMRVSRTPFVPHRYHRG